MPTQAPIAGAAKARLHYARRAAEHPTLVTFSLAATQLVDDLGADDEIVRRALLRVKSGKREAADVRERLASVWDFFEKQ